MWHRNRNSKSIAYQILARFRGVISRSIVCIRVPEHTVGFGFSNEGPKMFTVEDSHMSVEKVSRVADPVRAALAILVSQSNKLVTFIFTTNSGYVTGNSSR